MIDIHSHLLFGIDDGVKTLEESIKILLDLEKIGYRDIILTPHYIKDSNYKSTRENNLIILDILKDELRKRDIKINLYLGNEVFIDKDIIDLINNNTISSLNNSNYYLIELPISGEYPGYEDILNDLILRGKKVILAHPERYLAFQKDFKKVYELEKMGVIFQSNIDSFTGGYGKNAKKMFKRLLKEKKISFLATDIHHIKDYTKWELAHRKMLKYITEDEYQRLVSLNAEILIK